MAQQIRNYGLITTLDELAAFCTRLIDEGKPFGFDIETGYHGPDREKFALHPETAIIVGISLSNDPSWARYAPLNHDDGPNLDNTAAAALLWPLLSTGRGVAHNAGFEARHLARWFRRHLTGHPEHGTAVQAANGYFPIRSDTMVEAYLMAEYREFGLKPLVAAMFNHQMTELFDLFTDLPVNRRKMLRFNVLPLQPRVVNYACEDAAWCLAIHDWYHPQVKDTLLFKVEMAIATEVVPAMEDHGIKYDWPLMRAAAEQLQAFRDKYNAEIMADLTELVGRPVGINLASPPQVGKILYEQLGFTTTVYTDKTRNLAKDQRKMSTGKIAMAGLAKQHPVVKKITNWKEINRLLGTYLGDDTKPNAKGYESKYGYAADGMCHPNHLSAFVVTGRFAVSDPPYQGCVPGSYQVLTPAGWQRFDTVQDGTPVAQYHPDQRIDFVVPEVTRSPYDGPMVQMAGREGGTWAYTPNHRIVYRNRQRRGDRALGPIIECTAQQWADQLGAKTGSGVLGKRFSDRYLPAAGFTAGAGSLTPDRARSLRLAIACQADGSRSWGGRYDISVHKQRKVDALRECGLNPRQQSRGRWRVTVPAADVAEWLDDTKNFKAAPILALTADELRAFVGEVMQWGGDATREATYSQHPKRRASVDVVQAAAVLCGLGTSLYHNPTRDNVVTVNVMHRAHRGSGWQFIREVPADGMVYCVTVPTGMFLCRNDEGNVQVTGNSPRLYHYDTNAAASVHSAHGEAHGPKCGCDEEQYQPEPGTCFKFNFRDIICAPADHYILGFDLSQAELRAIAGEAQEKSLLDAFANGVDVHSLTAALMLGKPLEQIEKADRDIGKTLNFALGYGMSVKGLADRLGITVDHAQALFDKYFAALPSVSAWRLRQVETGKRQGFLISKFGRKLPIWEYQSEKRWIYNKGDRACVNYPIQSAATGDAVKIGMVRAHRAIAEAGLADRVHLVMNVHDALEFYVHKSVPPKRVIELLEPEVIFPIAGWPAMKADWHVAARWGSPREVDFRDGRLYVGGAKIAEPVPEVEVDEETGEDVLVLPEDLDRSVFEAAATGIVESSIVAEAGRRVVLTVQRLPDAQSWGRFTAFLAARRGPNSLTLRTPAGEVELDAFGGNDLAPEDQGAVSVLLGPATVSFAVSDVQALDLTQGLTF